ncbi:hypothetical protein C8A01DRAFT_18030 [Parachaetomium inaequale]|uniref:Histone chaperone domain-containing protein n=1 Tax=Parachaetomium inaequale TaxID=2588326 RepID=A0AAN6PBG4_9PEZI|nr:hypothetical protein C8A01DRAFT_18030 [Parachaetomium inaequale]
MRLPTLLSTLLAGAATAALASDEATTRTAAIYIQHLASSSNSPSTPPALLAELAVPDKSPSSSDDDTSPAPAEVLSYSAPDLSDDDEDDETGSGPAANKLVRIGIYDPSTRTWASSTSVAATANFAKGYAPHFVLTLDGEGNVLGVACRGVAIDAGVTRDFGPQAVVVRTGVGSQPALGRPVVLSPEGRKVAEEVEKSFIQKYWWVLAIGVLVANGNGPANLRSPFHHQNNQTTQTTSTANMSAQNGSTDPMAATNPENGTPATDRKGKGKAPAAEEPVDDTSMAEDDDDDDDEEDPEEEPEAADDDNMEEIDLDNVIGRRTRGKVIDFAKAAAENPAEDDEDEEDDDDFVEEDKMDED